MKLIQPRIFLFFLLPLCVFLTFNKHSKDKAHSYHGVIWADAAGYYVYLPMWFIYGNNADAFPPDSPEQSGNGFHFDIENNKVITKYYSGSAVLISPFFLISHFLAEPLGFKADGFSKIYSYGLYFSGVTYCCLGLFFLSLFLSKHFGNTISVLTALIFFFCTNLFYYSIDSPGMSHVYSFFLFSVFVYATQKLIESHKLIFYILFICSFVLAVASRPTSAIIILFPLFYENGMFMQNIRSLLQKRSNVLISLICGILCLLPQLFYFKDTFGSYFAYSYGEETFSNLSNPYLLEAWFSPNNGLFLYAPVLILSVVGMIIMIKRGERMGFYLALTFLLISYLFASWWNWWFGCSLGARSFVEFYILLAIPLAYTLNEASERKATKIFCGAFILLCAAMYFSIEYYYDGCFYGDTWDFNAYFKLLR